MLARVPEDDLRLFVVAVKVQAEVGSSLAQIIARLSEIVRTRQRLFSQIRALTAQSRMSGMVVGLLPAVVLAMFTIVQPSYAQMLFFDHTGQLILKTAAGLDLGAFLLIRRILKVKILIEVARESSASQFRGVPGAGRRRNRRVYVSQQQPAPDGVADESGGKQRAHQHGRHGHAGCRRLQRSANDPRVAQVGGGTTAKTQGRHAPRRQARRIAGAGRFQSLQRRRLFRLSKLVAARAPSADRPYSEPCVWRTREPRDHADDCRRRIGCVPSGLLPQQARQEPPD